MANPEYTEVDSFYYPTTDNPDLILQANSTGDKEWIYAFYEEEDIPDYLKTHSQRDKEAAETEGSVKLSRMTDEHLIEDPDEDWRLLE